MKLICPKCKAGVPIGGASRFEEFNCKSCNHTFMGMEAEVGILSMFLNIDFMKTGCPYCWTPIDLRSGGSQRGGYVGPKACYSCGRKLPKRPNRIPGTEWESDFEKIAKSLKGYSCSASKGADLLRRLKEVESEFCPTEFAQLKQMVHEAVARATAASSPPPPSPPPVSKQADVVQTVRLSESSQPAAPASQEWWRDMKCHFCGSPMSPRADVPNFPRCPKARGGAMYCK